MEAGRDITLSSLLHERALAQEAATIALDKLIKGASTRPGPANARDALP